jgi:hypothetical protein
MHDNILDSVRLSFESPLPLPTDIKKSVQIDPSAWDASIPESLGKSWLACNQPVHSFLARHSISGRGQGRACAEAEVPQAVEGGWTTDGCAAREKSWKTSANGAYVVLGGGSSNAARAALTKYFDK